MQASTIDALSLYAVDPIGLGGVVLRAGHGPRREAWLARLRELLPADTPMRRVPLHIGDERLLGGLDLAATLQAGRPIAQRGLLVEVDSGVLVLAMSERVGAGVAARLAAVLDTQEVVLEREGLGSRRPSRFGVVALDEGLADDESTAAALVDRLAFPIDLQAAERDPPGGTTTRADIASARARLADVRIGEGLVEALCAAALSLGVMSLRAAWFATRAARASAALQGRSEVDEGDAALAARFVLAPRATRLPPMAADDDASDASADDDAMDDADGEPPEAESRETQQRAQSADQGSDNAPERPPEDAPDDAAAAASRALDKAPDDVVLEAALASIPRGLLAMLQAGGSLPQRNGGAGRAGALRASRLRGRPSGSRHGDARGGARLDLMATLRAAAPWQALRHREMSATRSATTSQTTADERAANPGSTIAPPLRVQVRREDFHLTRYKQRSETTTLFVVDASGSAALHRLAETKGAVELLLADCYVRRDSVAVLAFRGRAAELLLPPTRSLVRAKRCLDGLPGGGGTPLASAIDAALLLAEGLRRKGSTPIVVLLTDGRANIARDGSPGRARATADAHAAAQRMAASGLTALLLDTSPQPQDSARELAAAMAARYLPLPHAGAAAMSQAVRNATADAAPK